MNKALVKKAFILATWVQIFSLSEAFAGLGSQCLPTIMDGRRIGSNLFGKAYSSTNPDLEGLRLLRWLDSADEWSFRQETSESTPWELSLVPHLRAREEGLRKQFQQLLPRVGLPSRNQEEDLKVVQLILNGSVPIDLRQFPKQADLGTLSNPGVEYDLGALTVLSPVVACSRYAPKNVKWECVGALAHILRRMKRSNEHVAGGPYLAKILGDPRFVGPLRSAALKILDKAVSRRATGNLFDDLFQEFKNAGFSKKEATDRAYQSILLSTIDGPNVFVLFEWADRSNILTLFSAGIIASAASILDMLTYGSKHPYSYPAQVSVSCDSGKPYHFWVSAFLAHDLLRSGYSQNAARIAPAISDIGYQIFATGFGRSPWKTFSVAWNATANQKTRLDLSYAGAGAAFGAGLKGVEPDVLFDILVDASKKPHPLSETNARRLTRNSLMSWLPRLDRWDAIFSPQAIFLYP